MIQGNFDKIKDLDPKLKRRLMAVHLASQGHTVYEIADELSVSLRSVTYWVSRFNEHGIEGLRTKPGSGRRSRLTPKQIKELREIMKSQDFPETGFLKHKVVFLEEIIPERFGVHYSRARLYDLLSRLEG